MKLGEVVVIHVYYNFIKFLQKQIKNKKVLLIAHFSVQNYKVSVESWKSYIVRRRYIYMMTYDEIGRKKTANHLEEKQTVAADQAALGLL